MFQLGTLCYVRHNGKTLMLHRIKRENDMHAGKWNGLGGKFEPGETPEACAVREIHEESGVTVTNLQLRGILTFPVFADEVDWMAFVFTADYAGGELIESPEGVLAWIDDDDLLDLELWPGDRIFIPWLDEAPFFSARFDYDDGEFVGHEVVFYPASGS
jgi:8-oxo-dGTP diphosphatase